MTRQEWEQQFAKHLIEVSDCDERFAIKRAKQYADEMEAEQMGYINLGQRSEVTWTDPIGSADNEMSEWSDDTW